MNANILSRRVRAVGFAIVVSIIMLSAAALASVGVVAFPSSSSGSANALPTVAVSSASSVTDPSGQTLTVSIGSSDVVVVPSTSPTPSPSDPSGSGLGAANQPPPSDPPLAAGVVTPTNPIIDYDQLPATLTANPSNGTPPYTYQWYWSTSNLGACNSGTALGTGPTQVTGSEITSTGTFYYCYVVTDSASASASSAWNAVTVNSVLTAPAAPTASATVLDANQALTLTGTIPSTGTPTYSWRWLVSLNGGAYATVTHCLVTSGGGATGGALETCSIPASTLISGGNYAYELNISDSASTPETQVSPASSAVTVNSGLTAPAAPTVSNAKLDLDQVLTVTGTVPSTGTPTYSWQWQVSVNGGGYVSATQCAVNSGSGASGGAVETCSIAANTLTATTYVFKLQVTDSATSPETQNSAVSPTVTAKSALTAPGAPTPSLTSLSASQALTVTGTIPSTGTSNYAWQWLISVNGGGYVPATQCALPSGTGAAGGAVKTCAISGDTLSASTNYNFELRVTDSATTAETTTSPASTTVTTTAALTAGIPTPTSPNIDSGQSVTLTANPSGGSAPYTAYAWYSTISSATAATTCGSGGWGTSVQSGPTATYLASPTTTTYYCYVVTDSASATAPSTAAQVTLSAALTAPAAPTVSATVLDVNQALTVAGTIPSTGTSTYSWQWLVSVNGGSYVATTHCAVNSGSGAAAGAAATCTNAANTLTVGNTYAFELQVTDSAMLPEVAISPASSTVTVSSALTAPAKPTVSATALDLDQALTVSGTIPSTGSPTYSWQWLVSINGGGYGSATQCAVSSGSGATGGAVETCSIAANTLTVTTYVFKLQVTDGATMAVTLASAVSLTVTVKSALTAAGTPTPSATVLDVDQALTVSGTIPSTGTTTYSWQWLVEVNGAGGYIAETQCTVNSGVGATVGTPEACSVAASTLIVGDSYTFELQVTDSATSPETVTSLPSLGVLVNPALVAPTISVSPATIDNGQSSTLSTTTSFSGGTSTYTCQWLEEAPGGSYVALGSSFTVGCTTSSLPTTSTGVLSTVGTWSFELQVTDSSGTPVTVTSNVVTVLVNAALAAPTISVSPTSIDSGQSSTLSTIVSFSGGTSTYSCQWLEEAPAGSYVALGSSFTVGCTAGSLPTLPTDTLSTVGTWSFELQVTDSSGTPVTATSNAVTVTVHSDPTVSVAPAGPLAYDVGQTAGTLTATITYTGPNVASVEWYSSTSSTCNFGSTDTGTSGTAFTPRTVSAGTTYYCAVVADSGVAGYHSASNVVKVVVTTDPTVSVAPLGPLTYDLGQTSGTQTATITYTGSNTVLVEWYSSATSSCSASSTDTGNSGTTFSPNIASAGTTYYCAVVSDSGVAGYTSPSNAVQVTVNSALVAGAVTPSGPTYDVGQTATLTSHPSLGTSPYTYQWYSSASGTGACNAGTLISGETGITYVAPTGSASTTYYCYVVTDSATTPTSAGSAWDKVIVNSALVAGAVTPSGPTYDVGQTATLTSHPSLGTSPYTYQWYSSATGTGACSAGTLIGSATSSTYVAPTGSAGTTYYCYVVTDSATTPTSAGSTWDKVVVNSQLGAPGAPTPSTTTLDADQQLWVNGTLPVTGTPPYSWQWLVEVNGVGGYVPTTQCAVNGGSGAAAGTLESCSIPGNTLAASTSYSFELKVTDSATTSVVVTSPPSAAVTTSSALTGGTPSPASVVLDSGQSVLLTATPSGGASPYTYQWYTGSTPTACVALSSPITGANFATYLASPTSTTYYCYVVMDTNLGSATSATADVAVNSTLTAPAAPTVSATALDLDQGLTATGTLPSTGTPYYSWQWRVSVNGGAYSSTTLCAVNNGTGAEASDTETCSIAADSLSAGSTYVFELQVVDSATSPETQTSSASSEVTVNSALTAPAAPTLSATKLDVNQASSVSGTVPSTGTSTYAWQWLVSVNGGPYSSATQCAVNGGGGATDAATETCNIAASTLATGDTYSFELMVTDSATSPETQTSSASLTVTVSSALTSPGTPSASAASLDSDQVLTITGTIPSTGTPTHSWQWLISTNGGAYADATQCAVSSGTGAAGGAIETCTVSVGTLTAGDTYAFELKVTDSASAPETQQSPVSPTVTVGSPLATPASPTVSATALDADQALVVTGTIPSTGTSTYSWQWLISINGGGFADATQCAVNNGSGASEGATVTCIVPGSTLTTKDTYTFQLEVTDGASVPEVASSATSSAVTVSSALTAPSTLSVSATALDVNQVFTSTGVIPSTGTSTYSWQWRISINGAGFAAATQCAVANGAGAVGGTPETCSIAASALTAGDTYALELRITDSASTPVTVTSLASSTVTVSSALTAGAPTPASPNLDSGQSVTLTANSSGGSSGHTYQWYSGRTASACTALGTPIPGAKSATYSASPTTTTYFCYRVTDSATLAESQTSPSSAVTVNPALAAPATPTLSATSLNVDQGLTVTGTIPTTGTPVYAWEWLVSVNGGAYAPAAQCARNGGVGAAGGNTETCSIAPNTLTAGDTYSFELEVTDTATSPSSQTSAATPAVTVTSPSSSSSSYWTYVGIIIVVLVVAILVALAILGRRRRPRGGTVPPMQAWQEEPTPPAGAAPASPAPAYLETPEDVGQASPGGIPAGTGSAAPASAVPAPAGAEPDIDVLMAELDRISGDILKNPPKKGAKGKDAETTEEHEQAS